MKYTNTTNIPVELAVWLTVDLYDYNSDPYTISVTSLLKSPRQLILGKRLNKNNTLVTDISEKVSSALGSTLHAGIEEAWVNHYKTGLNALAYPEAMVNAIRINPTKEDIDKYIKEDIEYIPVYMEQRNHKKIGKWTISGKFDFCINGTIKDIKSTQTYSYIRKSNEKNYQLQGSIYRWLNQDIVTADTMGILYIFTDWKAIDVYKEGYPKARLLEHSIPLLPLTEIDRYIKDKVQLLETLENTPETDLPECTPEELWINDPTLFKYYKDPTKTTRATKNFKTSFEAYERLNTDGNVGIVKEVKGKAKACNYCSAFTLCTQKDRLIVSGTLITPK